MLTFAPFHRVLARQVPRLPSNSSPIPSLNTHHHPTTLSAPSRVRLQTYAASTARSPSSSSSPLRSKWNKRLRTLGIATLVGAGALWWDGKYNARTLTRNFRTIWHGAAIALDYKCVLFLLEWFYTPISALVRYQHPKDESLPFAMALDRMNRASKRY